MPCGTLLIGLPQQSVLEDTKMSFWFLASLTILAAADPADCGAMLPTTTPPIIYVINYSGDYFQRADYIDQFRDHAEW